MTTPEAERLAVMEQKQKEMTSHIANLTKSQAAITKSIENNTKATLNIQRTLDELTGAKKFLMWFTSFVLGSGVIIATVYEGIKDSHK